MEEALGVCPTALGPVGEQKSREVVRIGDADVCRSERILLGVVVTILLCWAVGGTVITWLMR